MAGLTLKFPSGVRPELSGFTGKSPTGILGLHHAAYRCKDSEETRKFYEDFIGIPMIEAMHIKMGNEDVLHTFFQLDDGSCLAFFDAPKRPFDFKNQSDLDVHIAFEVDSNERLQHYLKKAKERGIEVRGPSDHGFVHSIYIRDPNGYVFELSNVVDKKVNFYARTDRKHPKEVLDGFMAVAHGKGDGKATIATDTWEKRAAEAKSKL